MPVEAFSGTWRFDRSVSELKSSPNEWLQTIQVEGSRVSVQEEIIRDAGCFVVEVEAAFDGEFYRVDGSPLVEEIAYVLEDEAIHGTGRKQGNVVLREVVSLPTPDTLNLTVTILMSSKEMHLGTAVFRRV